MQRDLPSGIVTFVFTDIEGSTRLLHELGPERYADALATHRRLLREAFARHGGVEVDTQGDAFFYAFPTAAGAVRAAAEGQESLRSGPIQVRMGVHTGSPYLGEEGYVGEDVHQGARIGAAGHGGQVLLSKATCDAVEAEFTDMGEHRLKDFGEPVWIFQLGTERFPPLKTLSNTNLPRPASSFVGREREQHEIAALVRDSRLVTLTGPGGSGKTRLAIEVAAELVADHKNGVFWVPLATLRDPALVTESVAQVLGSKDGLAEHIGEREMMLLLDNFEQVVEAATALTSIIEACPNLRILVTSRERLRVRGEVEYAVPPLARTEAVELFCSRARMPADDTIADLCARLDDLPLAVELAAARTSVLTPAQIRERLSKRLDLLKGERDADARQATLRATIEWSYDLLSDAEKNLFARLAVFAGGCTVDAAEAVADADIDTLQSLVDKSLVRHTEDRFWMLETIREYAAERFRQAPDEAEIGRRHAEHFLALAEEAEPHLRRYSAEWLERIEREFDNIRIALDRLDAADQTQLVLRLAGALADFWGIKAHIDEGRRRFEEALRKDPRPTAARAKALIFASDVAIGAGDVAAARAWAEESLAVYRTLRDDWGIADAVMAVGIARASDDDFTTAQQALEESVRRYSDLGDEHHTLLAKRLLAWVCAELGDRDRARALHEDNLVQARASGNKHIQATTLDALGSYAHQEGRATEAVEMLMDAARLHDELGDVYQIPTTILHLAGAFAAMDRPTVAATLLACSQALEEELGSSARWITKLREQTLAAIRSRLDPAALREAVEHGRTLTAEEAISLAVRSLEPDAT